jgi:hypothetical protein
MKKIIALILFLTAGAAHAETQYVVKKSTCALPGQWLVVTSSDIGIIHYTLDDFVSSGKFCEWRGGHKWLDSSEWAIVFGEWLDCGFCPPVSEYKCSICGRCRRKVKVNKIVEEWEP